MTLTRAQWAAFAVVLYLGLFHNLGALPLFDVDEGAFSEATREMLARGDFLTTYLGGELRFDKPILIYWLQAASVSLLGLSELAVRLPSALAGTAWVGLTFAFARRYAGTAAAVWAALFMAGAVQVGLIAKAAIADALLNLCLAAALLAIYRYRAGGGRGFLYGAFAAMGLGLLTKGPVALLIPFMVTLIDYGSRRRWREWLRGVLHPGGWALMLAIAAPWYIAEYLVQGQAFIDGFILKHNVGRFEGSMEGHSGSLLYFVPVLLIGTLPFTGLILRGLRPLRELWAEDLGRFLLIWFAFVLVFFSLSGTKLPHYIVYGYTPLFILAGRAAVRDWSRPLAAVWPVLFLALLALLPILIKAVPAPGDPGVSAQLSAFTGLAGAWWIAGLAALAAVSAALAWQPDRRWTLLGWGLAMGIAFHAVLLPTAASVRQGPVKEAGLLARQLDRPVHVTIRKPSFYFYARTTGAAGPPRPGHLVLTKPKRLDRLPPHRILYRGGPVILAEILGAPR
ncbi:MAG TPA: glycosyltransferase family 39 protein [Gammaproteobacteria bacterium]|nr:glycosyltransferase family 39 protein [Gammaproteobacteria bacterium]